MRRLRSRVVSAAIVVGSIIAACKYTAPTGTPGDGATDSLPIDGPPPACSGAEITCVGTGANQSLRVCEDGNPDPTITVCPWGCTTTGATPHCLLLQPSGGALTETDLQPTAGQTLAEITIVASGTIDTDDGSIDGVRSDGEGLIDGIEFKVVGNVGVFRFQKLTINAPMNIRGPNAIAIVALDGITINAPVDARGSCQGSASGPGGFNGGSADTDGEGSGSGAGGSGADDNSSGGGGGGYGGGGGSGGGGTGEPITSGGSTFGDELISELVGGGGGGGGGNGGGLGGGGGGAVQLASNGPILIAVLGGINAGGCGGNVGGDKKAGGGGGAGGAILLEGVTVELKDVVALAVNGGGGGGGDNTTEGATSGDDANLSSAIAQGGSNGNKGGDGGDGAADTTLLGGNGISDDNGGGGGGGVGWIRINTFAGAATIGPMAVISPVLGTFPTTTATQGIAVTQ